MRARELLAQLQRSGAVVRVAGSRLRIEAPCGVITNEVRHLLEEHKPALMAAVADLQQWPEASRECVRRFHRPEARLYPFIGQAVVTPRGRGRLLQVFPDRVVVRISGRGSAFLLSEVRPPGVGQGRDEPFEVVH